MGKRQRIWYDTEFLEDGKTIDLISLGAVREDGKEFYAVSLEANYSRVLDDEWLMTNVMSSIGWELSRWGNIIITDPAAKYRTEIRDEWLKFCTEDGIWPELWSWYGAYDHVAACQLFGRMIDLPSRFPMFTMDVRQYWKSAGSPELPEKPPGLHNALVDAKYHRDMWAAIREGEGK